MIFLAYEIREKYNSNTVLLNIFIAHANEF